jgi:dipeptidyl aminopeptidase/acylaminoacyl peptidase
MRFLLSFLLLSCTLFAQDRAPREYTVDQFFATKSCYGGRFSSDEASLFFTSDESGVPNVYSIELKSGGRRQLTFSKTSGAYNECVLPDHKGFLFSSDNEGDELAHIFLCEENGKIRDLTPGSGVESWYVDKSDDEKSFYFLSNKRNPKKLDLYEMDLETFTPRCIFQNDEGWQITEISRDARYVALGKVVSSNEQTLSIYDRERKEVYPLLSPPGTMSNAACFSPDSKKLYFLTDEGHDFCYLKSYSLENRTYATVLKLECDIAGFDFSRDGRYSVYGVNKNAKNQVYIFDIGAQKFLSLPKLPDGDIVAVRFSPSSKKILLASGGDQTPLNYYCYYLESKRCVKLTEALSPEVQMEDLVQSHHIFFPSFDGAMIPALYYAPHPTQKNKKRAAIIWAHGGPGGQNSVEYNPSIQFLVNHGYAVLAVNNRGSSGYGKAFSKAADHKHGQMDLDDCMWGKKFLLSTGEYDESKIGIMGGSYGGYLVLAALAFRPDQMAFGIDIFGVSNWPRTLTSFPQSWESRQNFFYDRLGDPKKDLAHLEAISPLFHAEAIKKPLLVIQGARDPRVLKIESDQIVEKVRKNGTPCEYYLFPDEGHGFSKVENKKKATLYGLNFLEKYAE